LILVFSQLCRGRLASIPQPLHRPGLGAAFTSIHQTASSLLEIMIAGYIAAVIRK